MTDTLGDDPRLSSAFAQIKETLNLAALYTGGDVGAEADVRAFRDGVPPPRVHDVSVGRLSVLEALRGRLAAAAGDRRPMPTALSVRHGDGLSHLLRWASEEGQTGLMAVAFAESFGDRASPFRVQQILLASIRLGGRTLSDTLHSGRAAVSNASIQAVRALSSELTPGGLRVLTVLLEAAAEQRTQDALLLLGWMQGERLESADTRPRGLPAVPLLAATYLGVVSAIVHIARAFGAQGMLVIFDENEPDAGIVEISRVPYTLVLSGGNGEAAKVKVIAVPPLPAVDLATLARRIRDRHVQAYGWPDPTPVIDAHLDAVMPKPSPDMTARDWVRAVTATLDELLSRQDPL
jgi:hypothetical protein